MFITTFGLFSNINFGCGSFGRTLEVLEPHGRGNEDIPEELSEYFSSSRLPLDPYVRDDIELAKPCWEVSDWAPSSEKNNIFYGTEERKI